MTQGYALKLQFPSFLVIFVKKIVWLNTWRPSKTKLTLNSVSRHFKTYFQTKIKTIICETTQTFGVKWKNEKGPGSMSGQKSDSKHLWKSYNCIFNLQWDRKFINSTTELNSTLSNSGVEFWNLDVEFWNSNSTSKFQIRHLNSTESNLAPLSNL